ncbi:MAG: TIGR03619 family F420-dependent LLM class oxidoreductase [Gammaproteobacteria bacterium]|nr:TIGR03619 family F420-dependent LLM class oxidoreductase [Gammaproteobacteria bacterium]
MKFYFSVGMLPPEQYLPLAKAAEEAGFFGAAVPESIFYPRETASEYPYHEGREFLEDKPFQQPLIAIAAMAAVTARLHFSTFVLKMSAHHPLHIAKQVFSIDAFAPGRVTLGVGISPWYEDLLYCGVPWEGRGERLDESIEVVNGLQSGAYFAYEGRHFRFRDLKMCPVPKKRIDIIVGGHAKPALRRAARLGDGWVSANVSVEQLRGFLHELRELRRELGTEGRPFRVQTMLSDVPVFSPEGYRAVHEELGVGEFIVSPWGVYDMQDMTLGTRLDLLRRFGEEVIAKQQAAR